MTKVTEDNSNPSRNKAGQALFDLQFGLFMFQCGREDTANECLTRAQETLMELEKELDGVQSS